MKKCVMSLLQKNLISVIYYLDLIYQRNLFWRTNYILDECWSGMSHSRLPMEKGKAASMQSLYFQLWKCLLDHETCLPCRIFKTNSYLLFTP